MSTGSHTRPAPADPPLRLLIAGGGTGGHVYPGLAVAEAVRRLDPEAAILFAGTRRGLEARLVPAAGFDLACVPASGFRGMGVAARLRFIANMVRGVGAGLRLLGRFRPDLVLGTGGFASLPLGAAARLRGVPLILQEQNAIPGSTNRLLGRWARRVYLGFDEARTFFTAERCVDTGNPVRTAFLDAMEEAGRADDGNRPLHLLVFGGSRGARTLNTAVRESAVRWRGRDDLRIVLQTGVDDHAEVAAAYAGAEHVRVEAYIDDMPAVLRWADLVVGRAGAMTLAELAVAGKPAVLVPFPHATDDHQTRNARAREAVGAARVLPDADCDAETLDALVSELVADPVRLAAMAADSAAAARPGAAMEIATDLMRLSGRLPERGEDLVP